MRRLLVHFVVVVRHHISGVVRREFAPYIGINWEKKFGTTADYARDDGLETSDLQLVVGFRAWF